MTSGIEEFMKSKFIKKQESTQPATPIVNGKIPTGPDRMNIFRAFLGHKLQQKNKQK